MIQLFFCRKIIAYRITGTSGITGSSFLKEHIDKMVWHLNVGLSHPKAAAGFKGLAVR